MPVQPSKLEMLQGFMDYTNDILIFLDSKFKIIEINQETLKILKLDKKKALGKNITSIFPIFKKLNLIPKFKEVLKTGSPFIVNDLILHHKSESSEYRLNIFKVKNGIGIIATANRKVQQPEEKLKESKEKYQMLVEKVGEALILEDSEGFITYANPKYTKMTGYTKDEIIGKHWSYDVPDEDKEIYNLESDKRQKGISSTYEATVRAKDGSIIPVITTASPLFTKNGEFNGVICSLTDITERKRAEEELIKTKSRLEYLVTSSPAIIFSCEPTPDLKVNFMSDNVKEILGYEPKEFLESNLWTKMIHPQDRELTVDAFSKTLKTGYYSESYRFKHNDGTYRWMFEEARLFYNSNHEPIEIIGFWIDITKQKEIEEDLIKAKEKYQMLIEKMDEGVLLEDAEGYITFLNPKLYDLLGYTEEEIIGKHWTVTAPEPYLEECKTQSTKRPEGIGSTYESGLLTKNGSIIPINITASPLFSKDGEYEGVLCVFTDITKQKQIEQDLIKAKEKYQMLIEKMDEGVFLEDAEGYITFLNPKLYDLLGYTEEEIIGKHWTVTSPESHIEKGIIETSKRPEGIGSTYESGLLTKDGSVIPISVSASPLFSKDGEYEGVLSVITDITKQKQIEEDLIKAKEKYQMLVESMQEGVVLTDENNKIALVNPRLTEMFGSNVNELIGKPVTILLSDEEADKFSKISTDQKSSHVSRYETDFLSKDGHLTPVIISAIPLFTDSGDFRGILAVVTDISEQKKLQNLQDQFIASTSHELRTPVTIIRGFFDFLVKHPNLPDDKKQSIHKKIYSNFNRLTRLISDVHDLTKISNKMFTVFPRKNSLDDLVKTIQDQFLLLYPQKGIVIDYIPYTKKRTVFIDRERIIQVIHNLVDNAVKNSPKESVVQIIILLHPDKLTISVIDYGAGIAMNALQRLFQPFSHSDTQYTTRGTGIGLYIVKIIVLSHKGKIEVHTQEGFGSNFTVTVPLM